MTDTLTDSRIIKQFTEFLKKMADISFFNEKQKQSLAKVMLEMTGSNLRKHKYAPNSFFFTAAELERWFGRTKFNKLILHTSPVLVVKAVEYNADNRSSCGYQLTKAAKELVSDFLTQLSSVVDDLLEINRKNYNVNYRAIKARDKNGNNAKCCFKLCNVTQVNRANLLDIIAHSGSDQSKLDALNTIASIDKNNRLKCEYVESASGRLYAQGTNLQKISKEVREAALDGCWDYDVENCHYSILYQLCKQKGLELRFVKQYLTNKDELRTRITNKTGVPKPLVKQTLIALIYGSKPTTSDKSQLARTLGENYASSISENEDIKNIACDISKAQRLLLAEIQNGKCVNSMKKQKKCTSKSGVLSHILQGYESKVLNIVGSLYAQSLALLVHDGWVSRDRLDVGLLQSAIREQIGFDLAISEQQINFAK